ncbi:hypothetical protein AB3X52_05885 [Nocardioides sp. DS6]|uniref:Diacylglycerol O-acyltransferase n=1 Tax=Nocardioides eburneus TaxID=3231482 RepID=A0ABV3SXG7_9ACTN
MSPRSPARHRSPGAVRLEFADDMFARGHRGVGKPLVSQRVWRLDEPYDAERLRRIADGLARGRLSRRVRRAVLPGARDAWRHSGQAPVVTLGERPIEASGALDWLAVRHAEPIDPHAGPAWRLAATDLDDGGALVSLTVAHAVADGAAISDAVLAAATGAPTSPLPEPPTGLAGLRLEVRDAAGQVGAIADWARARARAKRAGTLPAPSPAPPHPAPTPDPSAVDWTPPRVVVEFDTEPVAAVAGRQGGSANAWFIAVAARLLDAIGHAAPRVPIPVSVPISGFVPGDLRANSTRIARVDVDREALAARDLAVVQSAAKAAYARVRDSGPGLSPVPLPLVQMLPDVLLRRVPQPPQAACLASNLGILPAPLSRAMGDRVRAVSTSATVPHLAAEQAREMGGGLLVWHASTGARSTLTLIPAEPDRVPDAAAFAGLVRDELASWGVTSALW